MGSGQSGNSINEITGAYNIYVDKFETLYIADESNHRIAKKELGKSPVIVAGGNGNGSALNQLHYPTDFILDGNGGIYVYDRNNQRIMLWEKGASQGIDVTGKIGVSTNSYEGPFRLDNDGNVLYLDRDNSKLWRINRTPKMRIDPGETSSQMTIEFRKDGIYGNAKTMTISPSSIRDTDIESADIIINNIELAPEISIEASSLEIDENQENDITLTFNLNRESVLPISFDLTLSGTAEIESEYTISETSVSIPAGETSASLTISTSGLDDDAIEVLETIIVTPTNIVNATTLSENFTLNLLSDDYPALTISPDSTEFNEGDVQEFTVSLSEAHSKSTIVKIDFSGDMSPNDYVFTKGLDEERDLVTSTSFIQFESNAFENSAFSVGDGTLTYITTDTTWNGDVSITGKVVVQNGATLTITPGTVVKAAFAANPVDTTILIVAKGGKLNAVGDADKPIIFTTEYDDLTAADVDNGTLVSTLNNGASANDLTTRGLWGGIIMLGKGIVGEDGGEDDIEGVAEGYDFTTYGGSVADDNSGTLDYVSIRHGGATIANGDEINGLTLGGVGSGTTISNIEIISNDDDGIEFFGGNVDVTNILIFNQKDDAIDIDEAYAGTITNAYVAMGADSDNVFEIDGSEDSTGTVTGSYTIDGVTAYQAYDNSGRLDQYGHWKAGATGANNNIVFKGFAAGTHFEGVEKATFDAGTLTFSNLDFVTTDNLATVNSVAKRGADDEKAELTATHAEVVSGHFSGTGANESNFYGWTAYDFYNSAFEYDASLGSMSASLQIKAGEKTATYTLEFLSDLIYEGKESLVKAITITNSSTPDFSKTLVVDDFVEINTSISDTSTVEGENVTITASLNEVRSTETIVNFSLSGSVDQSDIIAQNDIPNNGIETLFGVNGYDDNTITDMMLHKGEVYFSIARSGVFKINADNTYSNLINYVNNNPYIRAFTIDSQDNVYVIEEHSVFKYSASTNYSYNDRVALIMPGNWGTGLNQLRDAKSISIDDNGDMIIVDTNNHRIVKWEQGGSEGTLLFGDPNGGYASGNSGLNSPTDLVFDGTYYYVLDSNNRKRIVVLDSDFKYVSSTINFNNSTAPEQYYIYSMFVKNDKIYVPLGLRDWNTTYDDKQGEIAVFNTYSESSPMVLQDLIEFKYTNELNEQVIPANSRGYFVIDDNGNYFLQGDGNKIYFKQNAPKIIIPAGSLSSKVEISVVDDLSYEGPEQLVLNPSSPNNDIDDNLVLNIVDNDEAPKINITFSAPFIDENQEESVEVIFTPEVRSGLEISFDIDLSGTATEEEEFIVSAKSLIIPANSIGSITVSTITLDDDIVEIAETITFSLSNLVNATFDSPATLELHSDDYPEATIISSTREFAEHETLEIEASLSAPHSKEH